MGLDRGQHLLRAVVLGCVLTAAPAVVRAEPDHAPPPASQEPAPTTPVAPPPAPRDAGSERLVGAIRAYQSGQYDQALFLLSALLSEPSTSDDQRQQALIYLAEVFLAQGNEASARQSFEAALGLNPSLQLDPFEHPPDVCAFFEVVRSTWSAPSEEAPPPLPPPTVRVSPWLPLGIPQISQGRPVPGTLLAVSQGLSCGLSAGMFAWLTFDRRYTADPTEPGTDGRTAWSLSTLRTRRAVQWTASAACQASYGVGVVDAALAQRRSRKDANGQATVELQISPTTLTLNGRF